MIDILSYKIIRRIWMCKQKYDELAYLYCTGTDKLNEFRFIYYKNRENKILK